MCAAHLEFIITNLPLDLQVFFSFFSSIFLSRQAASSHARRSTASSHRYGLHLHFLCPLCDLVVDIDLSAVRLSPRPERIVPAGKIDVSRDMSLCAWLDDARPGAVDRDLYRDRTVVPNPKIHPASMVNGQRPDRLKLSLRRAALGQGCIRVLLCRRGRRRKRQICLPDGG